MEYVATHYQNTDSNALVSFPDNQYADDISLINDVLTALIKPIDLEELITVYFNEIKRFLPLNGLSLTHGNQICTRGTHKAKVTKTPNLKFTAVNAKLSFEPIMRYWFADDLSHHECDLLEQVHNLFIHPLHNALYVDNMARLATKDALTGLSNRAAFDEDMQHHLSLMSRNDKAFTLIVIDLDNFKQVNDNFGHHQGDVVLATAASCISSALRDNEKSYRYGGDEFCCIVESDSTETANIVASRIVSRFEHSSVLTKFGVTASVGATIASSGDTNADMFKRADVALYKIKEKGKNGFALELK